MSRSKRNKQKEQRDTFRKLTMISQMGISMLVPIFLCFFIGMFIDKKCGSNIFMIIGFFLGAGAGFRNAYILVKQNIKNTDDEIESDYNK